MSLQERTEAALNHPDIARMSREYPYSIAALASVYATCGGDIEVVELLARLAMRPIGSDLAASILDMLRSR